MRKRSQRILTNILNEEVDRLTHEIDGKTGMEIRLIFEREGIVDILMAVRDLRSTAVSRYLGGRQQGGMKRFRLEEQLDHVGQTRMVWRVNDLPDEKGVLNGD